MRIAPTLGLLSLASIAAAWALGSPAVNTYESVPARATAALLLFFLPFAAGSARLGYVLGPWLGMGFPSLAIPLGAALVSLDSLLLASLGLIGEKFEWIFLANALALQLTWFVRREETARLELPQGINEWTVALAPLAAVAAVCCIALFPRTLQDVNIYHLYGPATWWDAGRHFLSTAHPLSLYASYWDYLHLGAFAFLSDGFGTGHLAVMTSAQLTHAVLGFAGSLLLGYAIFLEAGLTRAWALALVPALGLIETMTWTAWYGKNDWGVALWVLAGAALLVRRGFSLDPVRSACAAGFFHGLAAGTKLPNLSLLPCVALALFLRRERRAAAFYLTGALAGLAPIFLRNYVLTENPFYPLALGPFSNSLQSLTHRQFAGALPLFSRFAELGFAGYAALVFGALGKLCAAEPTLPAALALSFCLCRGGAAERSEQAPANPRRGFGGRGPALSGGLKALGLAAVLQCVFVALVSAADIAREPHAVRLLAPSFLLARLFTLAALLAWAQPRIPRPLRPWPAFALAWAWFFLLPHFPWPAATDFALAPNPGTVARDFWQAGSCRAWLKEKSGAQIVSLSDDNLFLGAAADEVAAFHDPRSDNLLRETHAPDSVLRGLAALGFRYFLHIPVRSGATYYYAFQPEFDAWIEAQGLPWEFTGRDCRVFDLVELYGQNVR